MYKFKKIICAVTILGSTISILALDKVEMLSDGIAKNSVELVEQALKVGASPNFATHDGRVFLTPLRRAIAKKDINVEIVKLLVGYKADVNEYNEELATQPILWDTVRQNRRDLCDLLIKNGANLNFIYKGMSILHICMPNIGELDRADSKFFKFLLDSGSNVDQVYFNQNEKFLMLDFILMSNIMLQAFMQRNSKLIKAELLRMNLDEGTIDLLMPQFLTVESEKISKALEELMQISAHLIAHGAPMLQKERDHEILKPMLKPYVDAISNNTRLFNPLARLVVAYIYNIELLSS